MKIKSIFYLILLVIQINLLKCNQIQRSILNKKRTNTTEINQQQYSIRDHFKDCDHLIKNKRNGFITSPNFPNQFPLPIYCRWVIDLSSFTAKNDNQTLIIYLNENYIKRGLKFTEYSFFLDDNLNVDKKDLSIVNFNSDQLFIYTRKKYLVIQFQINEQINHNPRILDSLANYYGFNFTFQLTNKFDLNDEIKDNQNVNSIVKDVCSFKKCNFNGRCLSKLESNNLFKFNCECFSGFHGEYCEFGPSCNPFQKNGKNNYCLNGGNCVYSNDLIRVKCKCSENYTGEYCERPQLNSQLNVTDNNLYVIKIRLNDFQYDKKRNNESKAFLRSKLRNLISSILKQHNRDINLQDVKLNSNHIVEIHIFYQINEEELIKNIFANEIANGSLGKYFIFDKNYLELIINPGFTIIDLNIENQSFNDEIKLNCLIKGITVPNKVKWLRNGELINLNTKLRVFKHKISFIANNIMKSTFIIQNAVYSDSGSFSCVVLDDNFELSKSINVQLNKLLEPIINPMSLTATLGDNITIDCYTDTKQYNLNSIDPKTGNLSFGYNWLINDKFINQIETKNMIIQDLYPTGSKITILNITKSTEFKCILTSLLGTTSKEIFVNVIELKNDRNHYCRSEFANGIHWRKTSINSIDIQKCPNSNIGEIRRECVQGENLSASWYKVDNSYCTSIEFDNLMNRISNYFLGYGNQSYENLINEFIKKLNDEINTGDKIYLDFLNENSYNLIKYKDNFNQIEYQKILIKLLESLSHLLKSYKIFKSNKDFNQFQNLIFKLSEQIDIESNLLKMQRINFENFDLIFIQNKLSTNSIEIELNSKNLVKFNNLDDKSILINYKKNHFILPQNIDQFGLTSSQVNNEKLEYFAIKKALNKEKLNNTSFEMNLPVFLDKNILKCGILILKEDELILTKFRKNQFCSYKKLTAYDPLIVVYSFSKLTLIEQNEESNRETNLLRNFKAIDQLLFKSKTLMTTSSNDQSILIGNSKIAMNIITIISCLTILILMILNLRNWRRNNSLNLQLCTSLIINHFSIAMALLNTNQKNENYWLMLFTLSQISALIIQFCICITIDNFDVYKKSQFTKNISIKITVVSTIVPFSLIGLIYEFYYTQTNFLWTLQFGSYLFYSIVFASLFITLANLYFYIKLNTKLQPFKKDNINLNFIKYENTSKILTQTIVITILLNIHLAFILLLINMPSLHSILMVGYCISSILILIVLICFKTRSPEFKNSSKRNLIENLSLNKSNERKVFKHFNSSNSNSNTLFHDCEIKSIYN